MSASDSIRRWGVATEAVDRLHTTAESHNRIMVLEVMGRQAGHIAAGAGIAGGAAAILVPEAPFNIDGIAERLIARASPRPQCVHRGGRRGRGSRQQRRGARHWHRRMGQPDPRRHGAVRGRSAGGAHGLRHAHDGAGVHPALAGRRRRPTGCLAAGSGPERSRCSWRAHRDAWSACTRRGIALQPLAEVAGRTRYLSEDQLWSCWT